MTKLWAYVHIHKCGGTSLKHILLRNFPLYNIEAKCLFPGEPGVLSPSDLKTFLSINRFTKIVWGHAVKPYANLESVVPYIKYFTLLRDPKKRYLSHYYHTHEARKKQWDFQRFLKEERFWDYQTKYIAGCANADKAIDIIEQKFALVGILEQFDEFLSLMRSEMSPLHIDIRYRIKGRRGKKKIRKLSPKVNINQWEDEIIKRNQQDLKLYSYVRDIYLPQLINTKGKNIDNLHSWEPILDIPGAIKLFVAQLIRKGFHAPLLGMIRWKNGLPFRGWM